jgi:hypothetical protein
MAIQKQEFYEGAALHLVARSGRIERIIYEPPFFLFNGRVSVLFKHSTKVRSPWGFTFTSDEQRLLEKRAADFRTTIGLICGADGVATVDYQSYLSVAALRQSAVHISCYRRHGEHYEISGPDGTLSRKIAPANWQRILADEGAAT